MAPGAVVLGEAGYAVHSTIVLVKLGAVYRLAACIAYEVFRVPLLVQSCNYLKKSKYLYFIN